MKQRSNPRPLSPEETTFRLHRAIRAPNQSFTVILFSGKAPWDLEMGGSGVRPNAATAAASSSPPEFQLPDLKGMNRGNRVSPFFILVIGSGRISGCGFPLFVLPLVA